MEFESNGVKYVFICLVLAFVFALGGMFGFYHKVERKDSFQIGDCILNRAYGDWESSLIFKITNIDTEHYGYKYIDGTIIYSDFKSVIEYNYRKVNCPKED